MSGLDTTVMAWRPDLAAEELRQVMPAARHVAGRPFRALRATLPLHAVPDAASAIQTELLHGEGFTVYELRADGWAWGQMAPDRYVGWVEAAGLAEGAPAPTHRVTALRALIWPRPDLKAPPLAALSLMSPVAVGATVPGYARIEGGWVAAAVLGPLDTVVEPDLVTTARRFLEAPYLWGGRSSLGLDCSGLVQIAAAAAGHAIDRDTRRQVRFAGTALPEGAAPTRNDLVFFPGHVGIAIDATTLIHATAFGHRVRIEPIADVAARSTAESGRGVTAIRRLG